MKEWDTMAKDKKKALVDNLTGDNDSPLNDSDFSEEPEYTGDDLHDDDEFEFDESLILQGVKLVELTPDFVRPEGFLMVPRVNKKTGEISPAATTFAGILEDVVPWVDNRKKERVWFSCTATADIPGTFYTGKDEEGKPFQKPVRKGDRIGISSSGAINALRSKKGHFILLRWTGNKIDVKNGAMWEIIARVSEKPVKVTTEPKN